MASCLIFLNKTNNASKIIPKKKGQSKDELRLTGLMVLQNHLASNTSYDQYVDQIEYDTQSTLVSLFNFFK